MRELTFGGGDVAVSILPEAGARLHRLSAFGHELLRTPDDAHHHLTDPFFWGAYVMAPWCNRLEASPTRVGSRLVELPGNFPDGTAIHGQVYARPWEVDGEGSFSIRGGGGGWPWQYEVAHRLSVTGSELRIQLDLTNLDDQAMPAGLGLHPWFWRPGALAIHARGVFPDNLASESEPRAVTGRFDLRSLRTMPEGIDATWTDLEGTVADPVIELVWPDRVGATMRVEAARPFIVAASPSAMDAIALEPQTHAPQGLRRLLAGEPGGLVWLEPMARLSLVVRLAFEELGRA